MHANVFFDQIAKRELKSVYFLHGDEEYAKERALEQLIDTTEASVRAFNVNQLDKAEAEDVIAVCEAWPMMDDKRLVIVTDERFFGASDGNIQHIVDYLSHICPSTCLVFVHRGAADTRKTLYKAVNKMGGVVSFEVYSEMETAKWAASMAKKQGVIFPKRQVMQLIEKSDRKLSSLAHEIQKLCDYAGVGHEITSDMIDQMIQPSMEYSVFEMLEYFLKGKMGEGLHLLRQNMQDGGTGAVISMTLFFAARLRNMLIAKMELERGQTAKEAAQAVGGNPYAAKKSVEAAQKFSIEALEDALVKLADLDYGMKSGQVRGDQMLEVILIETFEQGKIK